MQFDRGITLHRSTTLQLIYLNNAPLKPDGFLDNIFDTLLEWTAIYSLNHDLLDSKTFIGLSPTWRITGQLSPPISCLWCSWSSHNIGGPRRSNKYGLAYVALYRVSDNSERELTSRWVSGVCNASWLRCDVYGVFGGCVGWPVYDAVVKT